MLVNYWSAKLNNLNFHLLEDTTETQLQLGENKNYLIQRFNPFTTEARFYVLNAIAFST